MSLDLIVFPVLAISFISFSILPINSPVLTVPITFIKFNLFGAVTGGFPSWALADELNISSTGIVSITLTATPSDSLYSISISLIFNQILEFDKPPMMVIIFQISIFYFFFLDF